MNRPKAGAKAYNDTIKEYMSIEDKLELLYLDLINYVANENLGRKSYGFEIKKDFFKSANEILFKRVEKSLF